jgi:triosephosphate isomerase
MNFRLSLFSKNEVIMKIIAANWKLYKSPQQAREFFKNFKEKFKSESEEVVFFPSAFLFEAVSESLKGSAIKFGAQNAYFKAEGAFTGENSAAIAKELGAKYILIGHSERRAIFAESNELLAEKVAFVQSLDLVPMLCIGETLQERESGKTNAVLEEQLRIALSKADNKKTIVIAYEPVWAIGTGKVATPEQVAETHTAVADLLKKFNFAGLPVLYGGSVKPDNAANLIKQNHVSGFLVGGAALEVDSFAKIIEAIR